MLAISAAVVLGFFEVGVGFLWSQRHAGEAWYTLCLPDQAPNTAAKLHYVALEAAKGTREVTLRWKIFVGNRPNTAGSLTLGFLR